MYEINDYKGFPVLYLLPEYTDNTIKPLGFGKAKAAELLKYWETLSDIVTGKVDKPFLRVVANSGLQKDDWKIPADQLKLVYDNKKTIKQYLDGTLDSKAGLPEITADDLLVMTSQLAYGELRSFTVNGKIYRVGLKM